MKGARDDEQTSGRRAEAERAVLQSAVALLADGSDVSMRSVAAAAGMQTPTLYRLFADKANLLERVTIFAFEQYLERKRAAITMTDSVGDLYRGWDLHIGFGLENPQLYSLMFGAARGRTSIGAETYDLLVAVLERVAAHGHLSARVSVADAAARIHAATLGATFYLLGMPDDSRHLTSVAPLRDAVLDSVLVKSRDGADEDPVDATRLQTHVTAILSALDGTPSLDAGLRPTEIALLREWLARLKEKGVLARGPEI